LPQYQQWAETRLTPRASPDSWMTDPRLAHRSHDIITAAISRRCLQMNRSIF
jgi:hypothetical protein